MHTFLRTLLLIALAFALSECGTFLGRAGEASSSNYYKGVEADMTLLGAAGDSGEAKGSTVMCYLMVVCPLITLVSVPVDMTVDTLLLPVDLLAADSNEPADAAESAAEDALPTD